MPKLELTHKQIDNALKAGIVVECLAHKFLMNNKPNENLVFLDGDKGTETYGVTIKSVLCYGNKRILCECDYFGKILYGWIDQSDISLAR